MADETPQKLPGLSPQELDLLKKMFSSPLEIPAEFKAWLVSYLEANPPELPFTQLFGYQNFISTQVSVHPAADIPGQEGVSSVTYADAATVGPQITGLRNGLYIVAYGCTAAVNTATDSGYAAVSINGDTPSDNDAIRWRAGLNSVGNSIFTPGSRLINKSLTSNDDNSIKLRYRVTGGTIDVSNRWLVAIRYANA